MSSTDSPAEQGSNPLLHSVPPTIDTTQGRPAPFVRVRRLARGPIGGLALLLLCLSVYLPGLRSIPPIDRDESRFAQASRQMFETGDFVVPRVQDRPRLNKPPLIYWVQCASLWLLGDTDRPHGGIWIYRLPSVLAAIVTVLVTWRLGVRLFDPRVGWLAAALLAVCPMVVWDAHQARADQLLVATVAITQASLWQVWKFNRRPGPRQDQTIRRRWIWPITFWLGIALGILTKGPITPMIAGLTIVSLCVVTARWAWTLALRPSLGLVILAALAGPWVYLVGERVGWSSYRSIVFDEILGRSAAPKEGHSGPPGYHAVALIVLFWPGVLLAMTGLARAVRVSLTPTRRKLGSRPSELFCLAWIVPAWLVFECVRTKLPHYTMPLYPALAFLSARAVLAAASPRAWTTFRLNSLPSRIGLGAWLVTGLVLAGAPLAILILSRSAMPGTWARELTIVLMASLPAFVALAFAGRALDHHTILRAQLWGLGSAVCSIAVLLGIVFPTTPLPWVSTRLSAAVDSIDPDRARPLASLGFHEDSLIFLTRGRAERLNPDQVDPWLESHPDGLIIVPQEFLDEHESLRPSHPEDQPITGYNYSNGTRVQLIIAEAAR